MTRRRSAWPSPGPRPARPQFAPATEWWRDFGDEQLDRLMDQALAGNPTLKLAQARLARAQAVMEVAKAATQPQLNGSLDLTRQLYTENGLYPPPLAGSIDNSGTLNLNGSWELDFFGKNRAALDAVGGRGPRRGSRRPGGAGAAGQQCRARLFPAGPGQRPVRRRQAHAGPARTALRLVQDRVRAGLDTQLELRQSEGALPEARQQMEAMREQAELAHHALAALTGQGNREVVQTQPSLTAVKAMAAPAQLPADLLGQRADIVAARWRVEAAGHDVENAKAQFYPNINLIGFAGLSTLGLGRLFEAGSAQWGVGPAIRLPIFDAGRLRANLRGKTADLDAAVESYNATVLEAIHDAADQIASAQSIARQQAEQRQAQAAAESAYQIAVQRYQAGLGTYLNVLAAETAVLNQRRLEVDLAARALDTQVGLARAFGGGYRGDAGTGANSLSMAGAQQLAAH